MIAKTGQDRCVSFLCEYANCANAGTQGFTVKSSLNVFWKTVLPHGALFKETKTLKLEQKPSFYLLSCHHEESCPSGSEMHVCMVCW